MSRVSFRVDGRRVGPELTAPPFTFEWSSLGVPNGAHVIRAVAYDEVGNRGVSRAVHVWVENGSGPPRRIALIRSGEPIARLASIQQAVDAARAGDVVEIPGGLYFERVVARGKRGRTDAPVTLRPEEGADVVLSLADPRFARVPNALWEPRFDVAPGVYATRARTERTPYAYREDGTPLLGPRGKLRGSPRADFAALAGADVQSVLVEEDGDALITFVYLEGGRDPRQIPVYLPRENSNVLAIVGSEEVVVRDLVLRDAASQGVDVRTSRKILLDGLTVRGGTVGVRVKEARRISEEVTIRRCRITGGVDDRWFSQDMKQTPLETTGISVRGRRHVVELCHIDQHYKGIGSSREFRDPEANADIVIRRNAILHTLEEGMHFDGYFTRGEVYENLVLDTFKAVSMAPRLSRGPRDTTLFYRNVLEATYSTRWRRDPRRVREGSSRPPSVTKLGPEARQLSPRDLRFYHNTLIGTHGVIDGNFSRPPGRRYLVNTHWLDNIVVSELGPLVRRSGTAPDGNRFEGNLYFQARLYDQTGLRPMFVDWATPPGRTRNPVNAFESLAAARASSAGAAAGFEARGIEADPAFEAGPIPGLAPASPAVDSALPLPPGLPDTIQARGAGPDRGAFELSEELELLEISPPRGRLEGGDRIVVRGMDFDGRVALEIGGRPAREVIVVSGTTLLALTPESPSAGAVDVRVHKGTQVRTLPGAYRYSLSGGETRSGTRAVSLRLDPAR